MTMEPPESTTSCSSVRADDEDDAAVTVTGSPELLVSVPNAAVMPELAALTQPSDTVMGQLGDGLPPAVDDELPVQPDSEPTPRTAAAARARARGRWLVVRDVVMRFMDYLRVDG